MKTTFFPRILREVTGAQKWPTGSIDSREQSSLGDTKIKLRRLAAGVATSVALLTTTPDVNSQNIDPWITSQDITIPMLDGSEKNYTIRRSSSGVVINIPPLIRNADWTFILIDWRTCPPERTERQCESAQKVLLWTIISAQKELPYAKKAISTRNDITRIILALQEWKMPGKIQEAMSRWISINPDTIPKIKTKEEAIRLIQDMDTLIIQLQEAQKNLDDIRGTRLAEKEYSDNIKIYDDYAVLLWRPKFSGWKVEKVSSI